MLPLCERVGVVGPDCTCCPDMVWAGCDIQEQMDGCKQSETQIEKGNFLIIYHSAYEFVEV